MFKSFLSNNSKRYTGSLPQGSAVDFVWNIQNDELRPLAPEHGKVRGIRNVEILN